MDNQENETSLPEQKKNLMSKTQNTFLSTSSSKKFKVNTKYRITSSNMNKCLPPINTTTLDLDFLQNNLRKQNICYPLKSELIKNDFGQNNLKKRLNENRIDMNKKNNELTELKIKYYKLLEENKNTKNLIANILGVEADKAFSKQEIIERIEKCNPSEDQRKNLKYVYDIIKYKMEINDKRKKISEINSQIEYYTKNAKSKTINDLKSEYLSKCNDQDKVEKLIEKLEVIVKDNNEKLQELKNQYNYKKDLNIKIKSEFNEVEKELREKEEEKDKLDNIILELREKQRKMQDKIKIDKYKNENEESILLKKIDLENIEKYIQKRESIFKDIETRKNNIKKLEKEKTDLDKIIQELSVKNDELSIKMDNYNKEGPKLLQKSYEPLNNQRNMRDLEEKLKIFKKEYELTKKEHEERQSEIQGELDKLNEEIEENLKVINKNNEEKNKLNNEIEELKKKIEENKNEISERQKKIISTKKEMEEFIINEEKNKKEEEEKEKINEEEIQKNEEAKKKEQLKKEREYKKELDLLKREINKYKNENSYTEQENNNLKKEIEELEEDINKYKGIDEKIKEAQEQLDQLKST